MAREIDQAKLPVYTGDFSYDTETLHRNIKAVKPDYDPYDPKTWPLITAQTVGQYTGDSLLPPCVAYERRLVDLCVSNHADTIVEVKRTDGSLELRGMYFHYFPFKYNTHGVSRRFEYMHADHYIQWVQGMTGNTPATRTKGKDTPLRTPETAPDAFTEILEMLGDEEPDSRMTKLEVLRQALAKTRTELTEAKKQADVSEKEKLDMKKVHETDCAKAGRCLEAMAQSNKILKEKLKQALDKEKTHHESTRLSLASVMTRLKIALETGLEDTRRADKAEEMVKRRDHLLSDEKRKVEVQTKEVERLKKEVTAAKAEIESARNQIEQIRDKMKKARETEATKRKAHSDSGGSVEKKIKTEH